MTPSQEITSRFKHVERVADARGRIIGVGRLRISQQIKVSEMTPGLAGDDEFANPDGSTYKVSRRVLPLLAAAVREIQNPGQEKFMVQFPRNRAELDSLMDLLDSDGFAAVLEANLKLNQDIALDADGAPIPDMERAKN